MCSYQLLAGKFNIIADNFGKIKARKCFHSNSQYYNRKCLIHSITTKNVYFHSFKEFSELTRKFILLFDSHTWAVEHCQKEHNFAFPVWHFTVQLRPTGSGNNFKPIQLYSTNFSVAKSILCQHPPMPHFIEMFKILQWVTNE